MANNAPKKRSGKPRETTLLDDPDPKTAKLFAEVWQTCSGDKKSLAKVFGKSVRTIERWRTVIDKRHPGLFATPHRLHRLGEAIDAETNAIVKRAPMVANALIDEFLKVLQSPVPMSDPRACIEKGRLILDALRSGIFVALPSHQTDEGVVEDFADLSSKVMRATLSAAEMQKELARRAASN